MRVFLQKFIFYISVLLIISSPAFSQSFFILKDGKNFTLNNFNNTNFKNVDFKDTVDTTPLDTNFTLPRRGTNPTIPAALGVAGFFYLFNPIVLFENDKIALGVTKEISLGFGDFGENRISFEYSFIFRDYSSSQFRFGFKRDIIQSDILPSHQLQATTVLTLGASAFNDLDGWGVSPEVAYGFSLRNDKLLIYPHVKGRFTYCFRGEKSDIYDLSLGVMIGFANPFSDLQVRRHW